MTEITDEDRALIRRYVIMIYLLAYKREHTRVNSEQMAKINNMIKGMREEQLEEEIFHLRRKMRERMVHRINVRRGEYKCSVRGVVIKEKIDGSTILSEMLKLLKFLKEH